MSLVHSGMSIEPPWTNHAMAKMAMTMTVKMSCLALRTASKNGWILDFVFAMAGLVLEVLEALGLDGRWKSGIIARLD